MNARHTILDRIRQNKPSETGDAAMHLLSLRTSNDIAADFCRMLESIGGSVIRTTDLQAVATHFKTSVAGGLRIVNTIPDIGKVQVVDSSATATDLADIEITFLSSQLGVAENGAVWLAEKEMANRILPFITQHLVIVLPVSALVSNMHEAYARIAGTDAGYHVFIAGPSKTADIEQSLVIGAHGPRSLLVYLVG